MGGQPRGRVVNFAGSALAAQGFTSSDRSEVGSRNCILTSSQLMWMLLVWDSPLRITGLVHSFQVKLRPFYCLTRSKCDKLIYNINQLRNFFPFSSFFSPRNRILHDLSFNFLKTVIASASD